MRNRAITLEEIVDKMIRTLEDCASARGLSLSGITSSNHNIFLDNLFGDGAVKASL